MFHVCGFAGQICSKHQLAFCYLLHCIASCTWTEDPLWNGGQQMLRRANRASCEDLQHIPNATGALLKTVTDPRMHFEVLKFESMIGQAGGEGGGASGEAGDG